MDQTLDAGHNVFFGQSLDEVERMFGCKAIDNPSRVARKGIDKNIELNDVTLWFDTGRLAWIVFKEGYAFKYPTTPYPEIWKNCPPIAGKALHNKMPREDFLSYLSLWEQRARGLGVAKLELGDLTAQQFAVKCDQDQFIDMIHLSMGPSRRAGGGGIWRDGWTFIFTKASTAARRGTKPGLLESVSVFRDEFNTVARRKPTD
jgi:hypothetical protein